MASKVLDLTSENIHVVIYYAEGDPGSKFEIYHRSKIAGDPKKCLKKFARVCIICGVCRCYGIVAAISDDVSYLKRKMDAIREEFLVDYHDGLPGPGTVSKIQNRQSFVVKEFIKITDKETQTEEDKELPELQGKYEALVFKYANLKSTIDDVRSGVENSLEDIRRRMPTRRRSLSPSTSRSDSDDSPRNKVPKIEEGSPNSSPRRNIQNGNMQSNGECSRTNVDMVALGSGGTAVSRTVYDSINWSSYSAATRKLLMALFDRSILASHSLTGKPSPAFIGTPKQRKEKLDPTIVADIVATVSKKCGVSSSLVRSAITTKCADENKMFRKRMEKDKENSEPAETQKPKPE